MSFNAIRENKILAKISGSTVFVFANNVKNIFDVKNSRQARFYFIQYLKRFTLLAELASL